MKHLLICLLLVSTGCAFGPVDPDPTEQEIPIEQSLINQPITVEYISVNHWKVPMASRIKTLATISKYIVGPIVELEGAEVEYQPVPDRPWTYDDINELLKNRTVVGTNTITVIAMPNIVDSNRGLAIKITDGGNLIALFGPTIVKMIKISNGIVSESKTWELVYTHEFGHTLGVPYKKDHKWSKNHCTNPSCLMYPRPDYRSIWNSILNLGLFEDFCVICKNELKAARQ